MRMNRRVGVTVLLLIVGVATAIVLAPGDSTESSAMAVSSNAVTAPGMRVYLDPETGEVASQIDPNAAIELDEGTQNALRYDDEGLETVHHANGAVSMNLDGRYQSASVVHMDENGKFTFCTDKLADVQSAVNNEVSTPAMPEVK